MSSPLLCVWWMEGFAAGSSHCSNWSVHKEITYVNKARFTRVFYHLETPVSSEIVCGGEETCLAHVHAGKTWPSEATDGLPSSQQGERWSGVRGSEGQRDHTPERERIQEASEHTREREREREPPVCTQSGIHVRSVGEQMQLASLKLGGSLISQRTETAACHDGTRGFAEEWRDGKSSWMCVCECVFLLFHHLKSFEVNCCNSTSSNHDNSVTELVYVHMNRQRCLSRNARKTEKLLNRHTLTYINPQGPYSRESKAIKNACA